MLGTDTDYTCPNSFVYGGSYMDIHHSDTSYPLDDVVGEKSIGPGSDSDSETNGDEPVLAQSVVDLKGVHQILGEDLISFRRIASQENVSHILTEQDRFEIDLIYGATSVRV